MASDVESIKERLDIAEIVGGYVKLERAGQSFKGRCPFHNEKTPSFFVSPSRQSYYCFGCGVKGDIFTFVQEMEGQSFKEALKILAERAGVELTNTPTKGAQDEKAKLLSVIETATQFFENKLKDNATATGYLLGRGLSMESIRTWRLGYAPAEWRSLYHHLLSLGLEKGLLLKAGLIKKPSEDTVEKEPYDVFRDRLIFPLADQNGEVVAFSGRALDREGIPKYLNTPETPLFTKSELLYGLDKAKNEIRKKNYAVLVEGQIDLVLSHQAGVLNTVASSGTAFTSAHLERLKRFSSRIILAFDADRAGDSAGEKATNLALSLGLEVKVAKLREGSDPADLVKKDPEEWKQTLRNSKSAIEHFLDLILSEEKDKRKALKQIETRLLPLIAEVKSAMERSHFVSLVTQRTGLKEEVVWEDLKKIKYQQMSQPLKEMPKVEEVSGRHSRQEEYEEISKLLLENPEDKDLLRHHEELSVWMRIDSLDEEIQGLRSRLGGGDDSVSEKIIALARQRDEERRKLR